MNRHLVSCVMLVGIIGCSADKKTPDMEKPDLDFGDVVVARYTSIEDSLTDEQHVVALDRMDVFVACDTLAGFGKMRTITRDEKGRHPVETVYIDASKISDSLSFMRFEDDDGWTTIYLPQYDPGKSMIISRDGSERMIVTWSTADEPRLIARIEIPVRLQRWYRDSQYDSRLMSALEVDTVFRDVFDRTAGRLEQAQRVYDVNLRLLRRSHYKIETPPFQKLFP